MHQSTAQTLLPLFVGLLTAVAALSGVAITAWLTRRRERGTTLRNAVVDYITATAALLEVVGRARRLKEPQDSARFYTLNEQVLRTEMTLWLTFADASLSAAATEVSLATRDAIDHNYPPISDQEFVARRARARQARVALFEATRRKLRADSRSGLPPTQWPSARSRP